jgi:hypothetical protein
MWTGCPRATRENENKRKWPRLTEMRWSQRRESISLSSRREGATQTGSLRATSDNEMSEIGRGATSNSRR